jgi:hypothetical protein
VSLPKGVVLAVGVRGRVVVVAMRHRTGEAEVSLTGKEARTMGAELLQIADELEQAAAPKPVLQ